MDKESWCTVERISSQDWTRAERKHCKNTFDSKVFRSDGENKAAERLTSFKADDTSHKERRHFVNKCTNGFLIILIHQLCI